MKNVKSTLAIMVTQTLSITYYQLKELKKVTYLQVMHGKMR